MALINCPGCGQSISDKAAVCPHCGYRSSAVSAENTVCSECGAPYPKTREACPVCGCPNGTVSQKKSHKGAAIAAVILAVAVLLGSLGAFFIGKGRTAVYAHNLETVTYKMLVGAAQAETAGGLIRNVWTNTIYKKRDAETDKYTLKKGKFVSDFNTALDNLFADEEFQKSISAIQSNQNEVTELMKQLKNPPKEYAEAYTVLKTYYDNYLTLTKMVISPTGSLNSFTEDFNRADEEAVKSFEKMRLYLN